MDDDLNEAVQWRLGDNMMHSYYLDTVTNIRSTTKCAIDICMILFICCFLMSGLYQLRAKNYISNYHETWVLEDFQGFTQ